MSKKVVTSSPFIKFNKIGDTVNDIFTMFTTSKYGLNMQLKSGKVIGMNLIGLKSAFSSVAGKMKQGDKVYIKLLELKKSKRKNPTKIFECKLNGKLLVGSFNAKPAKDTDISGFFK